MSTKTEKRSAEETLKRLKKGAIAVGVVALLFLVMIVAIRSWADRRAEIKYQDIVAGKDKIINQKDAEIDRLNDEHTKLVATYVNVATEVDLSLLDLKNSEIAELTTFEYRYTDVGRYSNAKQLFGFEIPFLKKSFTAKWDGVIKAGVDLNQMTTAVDEENKILTVYLPEAEVLSHEIISDSIETLDEKNNIFNPIKVDDVRNFDKKSKQAMQDRAVKEGELLDKAWNNAVNVLTKLFYDTPNVYIIQFEKAQ